MLHVLLFATATAAKDIAETSGLATAVDWSTTLEVLLGAFVGFLSTGFTNWTVKRLQINKLIKKISLEVKSSLCGLKEIQEDDISLYTMESPIWDVGSQAV